MDVGSAVVRRSVGNGLGLELPVLYLVSIRWWLAGGEGNEGEEELEGEDFGSIVFKAV